MDATRKNAVKRDPFDRTQSEWPYPAAKSILSFKEASSNVKLPKFTPRNQKSSI